MARSCLVATDVIRTDDPDVGFRDADAAILLGAFPRRPGMVRADLLQKNVGIFKVQGQAIDKVAKKTIRVLVVGNPANTNALVLKSYAPTIPAENFAALTRLDQNRAKAQIAARLGINTTQIKNVAIWGNHSKTQYPDVRFGVIVNPDGSRSSVADAVKDQAWLRGEFVTTVQQRGAAVMSARKLSSAMSAAKAICDHVHDWFHGTPAVSVCMGVLLLVVARLSQARGLACRASLCPWLCGRTGRTASNRVCFTPSR